MYLFYRPASYTLSLRLLFSNPTVISKKPPLTYPTCIFIVYNFKLLLQVQPVLSQISQNSNSSFDFETGKVVQVCVIFNFSVQCVVLSTAMKICLSFCSGHSVRWQCVCFVKHMLFHNALITFSGMCLVCLKIEHCFYAKTAANSLEMLSESFETAKTRANL